MIERRGVLIAEAVVLALLAVTDAVVGLRAVHGHGGWAGPEVGVALAVLAALRRRFPERLGLLTAAAAGLSLSATAVAGVGRALGFTVLAQPSATESLALALLVGAVCRRLPIARLAVVIPVAALAMTAAPLVRYGLNEVSALSAVAAALLWGGGLALGLTLRNTDAAAAAHLEGVRLAERTMLARELHDLVAHTSAA
jgi:signal transduction histidine kinase